MIADRAEAMDEARQAVEGGASDRLFEQLLDRIGGRAGVQAVFGEPIERGPITVVPVARVRWAFGAGSGSGPVAGAEESGMAGGTGGGGGVGVTPVGYVEIGSSGATFRSIADPYPNPMLLIAVGVMAGFVLRGLARLVHG